MEFKTSVIIPCHNAGRWITFALQSVMRQTLPPHEIIVVDDSSTDDSISQISASGVPVKLLSVKAGNAAAARNAGIQVATGNWIAFLDADDIWYANHLARAAELLRQGSDIAFMSAHDWIDLGGGVIPIPESLQCSLRQPASGMSVDEYFRLCMQGMHFGHSTVLYRTDSLIEVRMFDVTQKRRHDLDLWLRMIATGTWTYDTEKGAGYREATPGSISKNELECDYYDIRALVKNLELTRSSLQRDYLCRQSRRAMGIAFMEGDGAHYARIKSLAWDYLSENLRRFYTFAGYAPRLGRNLITVKRTMQALIRVTRHRPD